MTATDPSEVMQPCPLGQGHEKHPAGWCCGAKLKQRPGYDTRRAGWGTDHPGVGTCKLHLGSTVNHRTAARRMLAEQGAAASLVEQGYEPIGDPVEELMDLAGRIRGFVEYFSGKVDQLGDDIRYRSGQDTEQLRSEMALLERFIGQLHRVLADLARLDLGERLVRLNEGRGAEIHRVLMAFVDPFVTLFVESFGLDAGAVGRLRLEHEAALLSRAITTTLSSETEVA